MGLCSVHSAKNPKSELPLKILKSPIEFAFCVHPVICMYIIKNIYTSKMYGNLIFNYPKNGERDGRWMLCWGGGGDNFNLGVKTGVPHNVQEHCLQPATL
jgi:hypothetical protein